MSFIEDSIRTLRKVSTDGPPSARTSPRVARPQQQQADTSSLTIEQAEAYLRYLFPSSREWYRCEITVPSSHCFGNHNDHDSPAPAASLVKKTGHDFALELLLAFPSLAHKTYGRLSRPRTMRPHLGEGMSVEWSPLVHFLYAGSATTVAAIQALLDVCPAAATQCHYPYNNLPLHMACHRGVSPQVMQLVVQANPQAVETPNTSDYLPLLYFLERRADQDPHLPPNAYIQTLQILLKDHPQTLLVPNNDQRSPLDLAMYLEHDLDVVNTMVSYLPQLKQSSTSGSSIFDGTYCVTSSHRWGNFNLDVPASQRLALLLPHLHQFQCVPPYLTPMGCIHLLWDFANTTNINIATLELELAPAEEPMARALQHCLQHNRVLRDLTLCTSTQSWRAHHHHRALAAVKQGLDLQVATATTTDGGLQQLKLQRWEVFTALPDIRRRSPATNATAALTGTAPSSSGDSVTNDGQEEPPPCGGLFSDFLAKGAAPPTLILDHVVFHGTWLKQSHIRSWDRCRLERLTIDHFHMTPAILLGLLTFLTDMPRLKELTLWHSVDDQDDDMLLIHHLEEDDLETCDITTPLSLLLRRNVIELLDIGGLAVNCKDLQADLVRNTSLKKLHVDITPTANSITAREEDAEQQQQTENGNEGQSKSAPPIRSRPTCPETNILLTVLESNTSLVDIGFNNCHDDNNDDDDMAEDGHRDGAAAAASAATAFVAHLDKHPLVVYYTNLNRFGRARARSPDTSLEKFVELLCHAVNSVEGTNRHAAAMADWLLLWVLDQDGTPALLPDEEEGATTKNGSCESRVDLTLWNVLYGLLREAPTLWSHALDHHAPTQAAGKKRKRTGDC